MGTPSKVQSRPTGHTPSRAFFDEPMRTLESVRWYFEDTDIAFGNPTSKVLSHPAEHMHNRAINFSRAKALCPVHVYVPRMRASEGIIMLVTIEFILSR